MPLRVHREDHVAVTTIDNPPLNPFFLSEDTRELARAAPRGHSRHAFYAGEYISAVEARPVR